MVFAWVLILFNPKFFLFELKKQNLENFDIFSTAEPWKSKVMNLCTNLTYDTRVQTNGESESSPISMHWNCLNAIA